MNRDSERLWIPEMACSRPHLSFGNSGGTGSGRVAMQLTHVDYVGDCDSVSLRLFYGWVVWGSKTASFESAK